MSAILTNLDTWLNSLSKKVNSELHNLVAGIVFFLFSRAAAQQGQSWNNSRSGSVRKKSRCSYQPKT
jgi:hypothetical protein